MDDHIVNDTFFLVTPYWRDKWLRQVDGDEYTKRTVIGFMRSSPKYITQQVKYMSDAYFNGILSKNLSSELIALEAITDNEITSLSYNLLHINGTISCAKINYRTSLLGAIMSYVRSPLQTRKQRVPLEDEAQKAAFDSLLQRMPLHWYVQKCNILRPRRSIVSVISHSYYVFSIIINYILSLF